MNSLRLVSPFAACLVVSIVLLSVASFGCEPLHRDIDPVWDVDAGDLDASTDDAAGDDAVGDDTDVTDDADPNGDVDASDDCIPGEACGPCGLGEITCDENDDATCQSAVDLDVHNDHCGECNNACSTDIDGAVSVCQAGECTVECSDDEESFCEGRDICVNLDENDDHCGACGAICDTEVDEAEAYCEGGVCIRECPDDTHTACEDAGICVDLDSDPDHCGECDSECATDIDGAEAECVDGDCQVECTDDSETICENYGTCADLQSDDQHCNGCGNSCPGPHDCIDGECVNV